MAGTRYVITVENGTTTPQGLNQAHADRAKTCQALINLFTGIDAGNWRAGRVEVGTGAGGFGAGVGTAATGTVTYTAPTGAQTVVIGGVTVSFTAGVDAPTTVQNAITAIRAHAVASGLVFIPTPPSYGAAINTLNVLTLWANTIPVANQIGNGLTLAATTVGGTAVATATFTGGTNSTRNGFNV